ncbi:DUF262 domain-containing protein [Vibrio rhizosphaerae]|nr:DUF262 domain-containing protein [Vibrio rhizosphaerae]MDW6092226.1 DUF262 domain-containing protein [Vibrio rhizosphaerae]
MNAVREDVALDKMVISVGQLLLTPALTIPEYQRPYKWTERNISQLFQDLALHQQRVAYRLGTVVLHEEEKEGVTVLNIVDGQQRILTLVLAIYAIMTCRRSELQRADLKKQLDKLEPCVRVFMQRQQFSREISKQNLLRNYQGLTRLIQKHEFTESHIDFLLNQCQVVIFVLQDISEAFQFFDSQNARGRDLEPHDLLKAFHLREFSQEEQSLKASAVSGWEAMESDALATLFAQYLYRVRRWASGHSARYFGKNDISLFKGVNLDKIGHFPYVESLRISHHYVDDYNQQYHRKIDGHQMRFPFYLDQIIINGRRFFEMTEHYQQQVQQISQSEQDEGRVFMGIELTTMAVDILVLLNSNEKYPQRHRTGDKYVRSIFDCALIFYIDKFGLESLSAAIEKIFIWAYSLRIKQQVVQLATMDNYVLNFNLLRMIKEAIDPLDVLMMPLQSLSDSDNRNNRNNNNADKDPLVCMFRKMNYYVKSE